MHQSFHPGEVELLRKWAQDTFGGVFTVTHIDRVYSFRHETYGEVMMYNSNVKAAIAALGGGLVTIYDREFFRVMEMRIWKYITDYSWAFPSNNARIIKKDS